MTGMIIRNFADADASGDVFYHGGVAYSSDGALLVSGISSSFEAFGASAANTAAENVTAMQAAFAAINAAGGGSLSLTTPGTYVINATLTCYSNTTIYIGPGVTIKVSPQTSAGIPVLQNYAFTQRAAGTTVTITWSSGTSASVAWTAHGLSVGDCFLTQGATLSVYNTVMQVITVTDANNVVVELNYVPSGAVSGTITAVRCDKNITIDCQGWIDYGWSGAIVTSDLNSCGVHLALIQNLDVRHLNLLNAEKFALHSAALRDAHFGPINAQTGADIVKCYGPMLNVEFESVSGTCGDDGFSWQCYEAPGFPNFQWVRGDMINCRLMSTNIRTTLSAAGLVACYPNEVDKMIGIRLANIGGSTDTGAAVKLGAYNSATDTIDDITVDGVTARCRYGVYVFRDSAPRTMTIKSIAVRGLNPVPVDTNAVGFLLAGSASIDRADIELAMNNALWTGGAYAAQFTGTYELCTIRGTLTGGVTTRCVNLAAAQTGHLVMNGVNQRNGDQMVGGSFISGNISLIGCDTSMAQVVSASGVSGTVNVNLTSNLFTNASGGVVRSATGTFNIRSSGNIFAGTSVPVLAPSGSPVFNLYGWDMALDPTATTGVGTTVGQFCTSTQTGNEAGACVYGNVNGTPAWYALAGGAAGVNAAIT